MKSITVFCGSSDGVDKLYIDAARKTGKVLAEMDMQLVYGGAKIGLMGIVADAVLEHGGHVVGVIPEFLQAKEVAHNGLPELILVETMHERKVKMQELADGVIAMPGGFGTLEEFFETLTWSQLGLHAKPMGLLNINGYFDFLLAFLNHINSERFLKTKHRDMILTGEEPLELLRVMRAYQAPTTEKWLRLGRT